MKKILSILFILCFLNGNFVIAQKGPKKFPTVRTTDRLSSVRSNRPSVHLNIPSVHSNIPSVHSNIPGVSTFKPPVRTHIPGVRTSASSVSNGLIESASKPLKLLSPSEKIRIDIENRGFVPEKHFSISQEKQSFPIESNEEGVSSLHIVNPPKVNLDKIRMKVMMKQNRLNKNEMKEDGFIIIGLLNFNEYGEPSITDYVA